MTKRPAEIHATHLRDDLKKLLDLIGGRPGADTDEARQRDRQVNVVISDLFSLIRSMIVEHGHATMPSGIGPAFNGERVTWLADDSTLHAAVGHEEPPGQGGGPERTDEDSKTVRRPGKAVPTYEEVCINAAAALAEAGFSGYSPLDIEAGIKALVRLKDQILPGLLTAQASTRQHLEASSHRAQIAEHYRAALQRIAEGPASPEWRGVARDALAAPEWDKRIRP